MKCAEFREWFKRALEDDLPADWPETEYRSHLVGCPACGLVMETGEFREAVADHVLGLDLPGPSSEEIRTDVQKVRGRVRRRRVLRTGGAVTGVLLLLGVWFLFPRTDEEALDPLTFGREFESADFVTESHREARRVEGRTVLTLGYRRVNLEADAYEQAARVILSPWEERFPDARLLHFYVFDRVHEYGMPALLGLRVVPGDLPELRRLAGEVGAADLCSRVAIDSDLIGTARSLKDQRERD